MRKKIFKLKDTGKDLNKLFDGISKKEYIWHLEWDDIHSLEKDFEFIFKDQTIIKNDKFWKILNKYKYTIISTTIKLYQSDKDFKEKKYAILLQVDDTEFGTISVYNKELEKIIEKNISL